MEIDIAKKFYDEELGLAIFEADSFDYALPPISNFYPAMLLVRDTLCLAITETMQELEDIFPELQRQNNSELSPF